MVRGMDLFIPGLASFLMMQLFYIFVFRAQIAKNPLTLKLLLSFAPFVVYAVILVVYISPNIHDSIMRAAVWIYAASISIMSWQALCRRHSVSTASFLYVFIGTLLFMVSDSLIAIDRFVAPISKQALLIMGTYAAAQLFITIGITKTNQADKLAWFGKKFKITPSIKE
jgi:uncharacterized membrane protein YhhN